MFLKSKIFVRLKTSIYELLQNPARKGLLGQSLCLLPNISPPFLLKRFQLVQQVGDTSGSMKDRRKRSWDMGISLSFSQICLYLCLLTMFHDATPYSSRLPRDGPFLRAPSFFQVVPAKVLAPARLPNFWIQLRLVPPLCIQPVQEKEAASCCGESLSCLAFPVWFFSPSINSAINLYLIPSV